MMTISTHAQVLEDAQLQGLDRLDAQLLLLHVLRRPVTDRAWLLAHDGDPIDGADLLQFQALCRRRIH